MNVPVQEEDDPLGLDGDVPGQLDDSLPLVVAVVQAESKLLELLDDGVVRIDNGLRVPLGRRPVPSAPLTSAASTTSSVARHTRGDDVLPVCAGLVSVTVLSHLS